MIKLSTTSPITDPTLKPEEAGIYYPSKEKLYLIGENYPDSAWITARIVTEKELHKRVVEVMNACEINPEENHEITNFWQMVKKLMGK